MGVGEGPSSSACAVGSRARGGGWSVSGGSIGSCIPPPPAPSLPPSPTATHLLLPTFWCEADIESSKYSMQLLVQYLEEKNYINSM